MRDPVAVRLAEIRERDRLSLRAMAEAMDVDTAQLYRALYKEQGVGRKLLDGAIRAYPEIADVYAQSLTINHDSVAQTQHLGGSDAAVGDEVPMKAVAI